MHTGVKEYKPSCDPNPCHPGVTCTETVNGIRCGPCPQGMEGNGTHCTDTDEVWSQETTLQCFFHSEIYTGEVFVLVLKVYREYCALSAVNQNYGTNPLYASVRSCMCKSVDSDFL